MSCVIKLVFISALLTCGLEVMAANLYRYENDQGVIVLDYTVPQKYVHKGYSVLDEKGRVVEVVPAMLTDDELKEATLEKQAQEEAERLRQRDELLLERYSSIADIEARRNRRIGEIIVRLTILKGNIAGLKTKLESMQADAADIERQGREVPDALSGNIKGLRNEIVVSDDLIAKRQKEKVEIQEQFASDIERFEELLVQAEKRRGIYRPQ